MTVPYGFKRLVTCFKSKPILTKATFKILQSNNLSLIYYFTDYKNLYCVNCGWHSELIAALIIMQTHNVSLGIILPQKIWIFITKFMQTLLLPSTFNILINLCFIFWHKKENLPFCHTFKNYCMWFNHIINIRNLSKIFFKDRKSPILSFR